MTDFNRSFVAYTRFLQNRRERGPRQNPDDFVQFLLPPEVVAAADREDLSRYRRGPSYHYLLARTRHYDDVFRRAVTDGARQVLLIGGGTDTRAYRFASLLNENCVRVIETDVPEAIRTKESRIRSLGAHDHVSFRALTLGATRYRDWFRSSGLDLTARTLVLAEGVSPYVGKRAFKQWLSFLADNLAPESVVAYDLKIAGVDDRFGRQHRWRSTFRLPNDPRKIARFHERLGLTTVELMDPDKMLERYLEYTPSGFFQEDIAVVLMVPP